ncbi:MAG: hypothetical protein AAF487_08680 [Bacteroidota bacterium]
MSLAACVEENTQQLDGGEDQQKKDPNKAQMLKLNNQLFSIPSPIQSAKLFQELNLPYNNDNLHSADALGNYATSSKKGLNLGVYGADLGYVSLYAQEKDATELLGAINKLVNDLDLTAAIDENLVNRFIKNMNNSDSLVYIVSDFYDAGDSYLKENDRSDIAGLVLAGGWIEGMYLTTTNAGSNEKVIARISEQKSVIGNLIKILEQTPDNAEAQGLIEDLVQLENIYDKIDYEYVYVRPETMPDKRRTKIKSRTEFSMSDDVLNEIKNTVESLRNKIIS